MVNSVNDGFPTDPKLPDTFYGAIGKNSLVTSDTTQPWLSIDDYLSTLSTAKANNKQAILDAIGSLSNADVLKALGERAAALIALFSSLQQVQVTLANLRAQQLLMNQTITSYNNTIRGPADALNAATNAYNAAPGDLSKKTAYQNALQTYKTAISSGGQSYNTKNYNTALDAYNNASAAFSAAGIPVITPAPTAAPFSYSLTSSPGQPPDGNATPPIPNVSVPNLAQVPVLASVPTLDQLTKQFFLPAISAAIASLQASQDQIATQTALAALNSIFTAVTGDITLPVSYIKRIPTVYFDGNSLGSGNGVGLVTASLSTSSPTVSRIIGNALYTSFAHDTDAADALVTPMEKLALDFVEIAAKKAVDPVTRQLSEKSLSTDNTAKDVVIAQSFANSIRDEVSGDSVETAVKAFVNASSNFSKLTVAEKQDLTTSLTAALSLGLLNVGLVQLAGALNLPGLTAQVLGNVTGSPSLPTLFAASDAAKLDKVLTNPPSVLYLKASVSASLVSGGSGITQTQADAYANQLINGVAVTGGFKSYNQLEDTVRDVAKKIKLSDQDADNVAAAAVAFVQRESSLPSLDTSVNPQAQAALIAALEAKSAANAPYETGSPQRIALEKLVADNKNDVVLKALKSINIAPDELTNRNFASQLSQQLVTGGVSKSDAQRISGTAVGLTAPQSVSSSSSPLSSYQPATLLPVPQLAEDLSNKVQAQVGSSLDPSKAKSVADQTVRTVLGPSSILSEYNAKTRTLRDEGHTPTLTQFNKDANVLTAPNIVLNQLTDNVNYLVSKEVTQYMNPIAQDSLTRNDMAKQPTNFKRNMDIQI